MIDWGMVASNSLWILGLSVLLTAFSYHRWLAAETDRRYRDLFSERVSLIPYAAGLFLTCAGWGLSQAARWWEKAIWFALAAIFAWQTVSLVVETFRRSRDDARRESQST